MSADEEVRAADYRAELAAQQAAIDERERGLAGSRSQWADLYAAWSPLLPDPQRAPHITYAFKDQAGAEEDE